MRVFSTFYFEVLAAKVPFGFDSTDGRFGEISYGTARGLPQMRENAASAKAQKLKVEFVRSLPVHARCSERRLTLDLPFVGHAAKGLKEPKITYAARRIDVGFHRIFRFALGLRQIFANSCKGNLIGMCQSQPDDTT